MLLLVVASGCGGPSANWDDLGEHQVRITEIHYHDPASPESEFVEITNAGPGAVTLTNWCIEGIGFCFEGRVSVEEGEHVIVDGTQMDGELRNSGEEIRLLDGNGAVRDTVSYGDSAPWPTAADGVGFSLQLTDDTAATGDISAWTAAPPTPAEPLSAAPRSSSPPSVAVVEVNYHDPLDDFRNEFVELLNTTSRTLDLSGWRLESGALDVALPSGARVPADGRYVVTGFSELSNLPSGDTIIRLLDDTGAVVDSLAVADADPWPAMADGHGESLHRLSLSVPATDPGNWVSAPPTPGAEDTGLPEAALPVFSDVDWTRSPRPTQTIAVTAHLRGARSAEIAYRVGFGNEELIRAAVDSDGRVSAAIPGQVAGTLVRFRLQSGNDGNRGTWPRQGDGSGYAGTVVAGASPSTDLPVVQWFMDQGVYTKANTDRTLSGDSGYPFVLAIGDEVFDNAVIRMKGQQSRYNPKHKWKITLPAGHRWADHTFFSSPANEFALNAMSTDKSYVREILTSDLVGMTGGYRLKANAVRVQRNGEFQGVYVLTEQPDKSWRAVQGLSARTVVWKAERQATMQTRHLTLPRAEFAARFHRQTQRYDDSQAKIRELIKTVNLDDDQRRLDYAYRSIDIPQVINVIASMRVAQHFEWDHKNYEVMFDPQDGRWRLLAIDYDLNMGSRWHRPCGSFCFESLVYSYDHFKFNKFGALFINTPSLRSMLDRRTKTIADRWFAGDEVEQRVAELARLYGEDDDLDVKEWHSGWGRKATDIARGELLDGFVAGKREQMVVDEKKVFPSSQPANIAVDVRYRSDWTISVTNRESFAVDLSGRSIPGLPSVVPAGVVLNKGQTVFFTFDRTPLDEVRTVGGQRALVVWVPGYVER